MKIVIGVMQPIRERVEIRVKIQGISSGYSLVFNENSSLSTLVCVVIGKERNKIAPFDDRRPGELESTVCR